MTSVEIRKSFLDFFAAKEHRIVQSAPVVPHDDPTLLFINAGMNQFKDVFLGHGQREYSRAADTQKCIRVSGKHNDLEEVGRDTYHHTFFEMLGNWSFGDYYKREAIAWSWELLTEVWKLPKERLHATVYENDDEAFALWTEVTDINPTHVHRFGAKDNFWEMGETGPCGPCTEIHFDQTEDFSGAKLVNAGVADVIEIWNLVFIQYNRDASGVLTDLPKKHVDTGMGFERVCAVLQGASSNYETDVFTPLIGRIEELCSRTYEGEENRTAMRVIADHVRMLAFSIADGAMPGPDGRSYVLRRILRRAARFGRNLGMHKPFIWNVVGTLVDTMGEVFPELREQRSMIEKIIRAEEESFNATLDRGLEIFEGMVDNMQAGQRTVLDGSDAFKLYDTFGFPIDLTGLLAEERGLTVDLTRFDELLAEQKERSRAVTKSKVQFPTASGQNELELEMDDSYESARQFVGYDTFSVEAATVGLRTDGEFSYIVLRETPFYIESGGQIGDLGTLTWNDLKIPVEGLIKAGDNIVHVVRHPDFHPSLGDVLHAEVDGGLRRSIMRNHTATHLLHASLREVLGTHVQQAGSLVDAEKLRFDFSHFEKVRDDDLEAIEKLVNMRIFESLDVVQHRDMPFEDAKHMGALMFFGDKYGDRVNVMQIGDFSMEFCGGTHVRNTSEIGLFKIISESSIASGTRRIEAVSGQGVQQFIGVLETEIRERLAHEHELMERIRQMEKEIAKSTLQRTASSIDELVENSEEWDGMRIVASRVDVGDAGQLKSLGDVLREKMKSGVGLLAAVIDDKVLLVCVVTDDLIKERKLKAGAIVGAVAKQLGGGGGGKPHMATAGARNAEKLDEVLLALPTLVKENAG